MSLIIELVETKQQLPAFIKVPWQVNEREPNWVPWLYYERLDFFDKQKNPFFSHAEADFFIARRNGRPVGSIAAILNHRHNEFHNENVAHFGAFEVLPDPEAAAALLETACNWARQQGAGKILGPFNLSTNDECGLLVDGFDQPPRILMPYNPPYYAGYIEACNFTKAMDLLAWHASVDEVAHRLPQKLVRVVNKVKERHHLTIRPLNLKQWDEEIVRVKTLYNSAWERNWGFVPLTDAEMDALAQNLKLILDPAITFAVEKDGEPVGFSVSLPDVNQILHKLRPGSSVLSAYLAGARLLLYKRRVDALRVFALGVMAPYRGHGVDALMYYETARAAARRGYKWAEASWILETNDMMNRAIAMMGAKVYKTYRIYEKALD